MSAGAHVDHEHEAILAYENRDREALQRELARLKHDAARESGLEWRLKEATEYIAALLVICRDWEPDHASAEERRTLFKAREHAEEARAFTNRK